MMRHCQQRSKNSTLLFYVWPKFCSMRISQDIRNYAKDKDLNTTEAIHQGMQEKAEEFKSRQSNLPIMKEKAYVKK